MALFEEIPRHGSYLSTQGFQLFQRLCQAVATVHIQHTSGVEVVRQVVELISDLAVLVDETRQFQRYHGNLLPADRPPLFEHLSKKLAGRHIAHDRSIQNLLIQLVVNPDSDSVGILASCILRCTH